MKIYGQIEGASLENLTTDPTVAIAGRIYLNTTTGKAMLDDGTSKRALFRNDGKFIYGTDTTAANNIKFHHAGAGILQILPGNDTTAENVMATSLAQVGLRVTNLAAAPAVGNAGRLYFNTTTSSVAFDTGTAFLQFATLTGTETLTNKTLTTPVVDVINVTDQANTPATPTTGTLLYTKAGSLYKIAPDGLEVQVGSGASGGAGYNYLLNGDFESGITTVQYASTALTGGLPSGTGPTLSNTANSITLSSETTAPLRRTRSLRATAASAWTAGQGFSVGPQITVQPGDLGRILTVNLTYQVVSGNGTLGYTGLPGTQGLAIAVYDVTAGAWLPAPVGSLSFNTGFGPQPVTASFQSSTIAGQKYQVFVFNLVTSTAAVTVLFDDISVGPNLVTGADARSNIFVGTPVGTTLTANSTNVPFTAIKDASGAWNGTQYIVQASGDYSLSGTIISGSTAHTYLAYVNGTVVTSLGLNNTNASTRSTLTGWLPNLKVNDAISIRADANVTVVAANDRFTINRVVAASGSGAEARTVHTSFSTLTTTAQTASTPLKFTTINDDTTGSGSAANGTFTVPQSGVYVGFVSGVASTGGTSSDLFINVNGTPRVQRFATLLSGGTRAGSSATFRANTGDVVTIAPATNFTAVDTTCQVSFFKASGPVGSQAVESVNATYFTTAAQSVAAGAVCKYDNRAKDTHSAYNPTTGLYTCPLSGQMSVSIVGCANAQTSFYLVKNGVAQGVMTYAGTNLCASASVSISVQANDTLGIYSDVATSLNAANARGTLNQVTFERTGN